MPDSTEPLGALMLGLFGVMAGFAIAMVLRMLFTGEPDPFWIGTYLAHGPRICDGLRCGLLEAPPALPLMLRSG